MGVTRLAINRPIAILMLVAAFLVLGLVSYSKLPAELNPKVDFPVVSVQTSYAGTNPQEMETLITKPIEDAISGVAGLKEISSTSQQGVSVVHCTFYLGTNLDTASSDVRQKVDAVRRRLPTEADSPSVSKQDNSSQPILYIAMKGNRSSRELRILAQNVVSQRLQQAPDVSAVNVFGGDQREIRVSVRESSLAAYGITISQLSQAIQNANSNISAGYIQTANQFASIRFLGQFGSVQEIKDLRVTIPSGNGGGPATGDSSGSGSRVIRLADLATIQDTTVERTQSSTLDGQDSVTLAIQKTSDGNTLAATDGVKKQMVEVKKFLPADVNFVITRDDSTNVRDNLRDVVISLCLGAFLSVLIVFVFLHNIRATIIIAIAIPTCLIATFLPISAFGFTLNSLTLLGLSLAIGILIDDSIVVLENIVRHLRLGQEPVQAAITGRSEIGLAALTLTAVDLVVFVPIAFMGGIIGEFFRSFGVAISVAVLFSLFVSFTLTPMLASRWFKKGEELENTGEGRRGFGAAFDRGYHRFERSYERILRACLRHPWTVAIFGNMALVLMLLYTITAGSGTKMLPMAAKFSVFILIVGFLAVIGKPLGSVLAASWSAAANWFRTRTAGLQRWQVWLICLLAVSALRFAFVEARPVVLAIVAVLALLFIIGAFWNPFKLRFALESLPIAGLCIAAVFAVVFLAGKFGTPLGFRFAPGQDQNQVAVSVETPAGSSLAFTKGVADEVERRIHADKMLRGQFKYLLTSIGRSQNGGQGSGNSGTNYANIQVSLYDKRAPFDTLTRFFDKFNRNAPPQDPLRTMTDEDVAKEVRKIIKTIPGAGRANNIQASAVNGFGGGGAPLTINLVGSDFNQLIQAANKIKGLVTQVPGVFNTDLSFKASQPELQIRLDRVRAAEYGLNVNQVAQAVSTAIQGDNTAKFRDPADNEQYDIRIQLTDVDRNSIYQIGNTPVASQNGVPVPLSDVANISMGAGPTRVDRLNRLRQIAVTGYLLPGTQIGNVRQKVDPQIKQLADSGQLGAVSYQWGGEAQSLSDEGPFLLQAIGLGIMLSYMLMAALFNNMLYPLTVMLTLPQALVGALLALLITGTPLSLIAAIGIIMLNGVATKNAILMVDYTNTLRSRGYKRLDALLTAAPTRLRPILMTSGAIICATLPTALALGRGAGFRQPLAITVVGGVLVSTFLTLLVIPCIYLLFDNFSNWVSRRIQHKEIPAEVFAYAGVNGRGPKDGHDGSWPPPPNARQANGRGANGKNGDGHRAPPVSKEGDVVEDRERP